MSEGCQEHYNKRKITTQNDTKQSFTDTNELCWTPERIRYELSQRGFSLVGLARHHGVSESTFRICLRKRWHEAEVLLANALSTSENPISPQDIWPDRYDNQGLPLKYSSHLGNQNARKRKSK